MINCIFYFDKDRNFQKFSIYGHANSDKNIVNTLCTGVSILSQSIILGFINLLKITPLIDKKSGLLDCEIEQFENLSIEKIEKINFLISLFLEGLNDLKKQFPLDLSISIVYL